MKSELIQVLPNANLTQLHNLYKGNSNHLVVSNVLTCLTQWSEKCPENFTVYVTTDWETTGTFIAHLHFDCYQLVAGTLEESCTILARALTTTEKISWKNVQMFLMPQEHLFTPLMNLLREKKVTFLGNTEFSPLSVWWICPEEAKQFQIKCPPHLYLDQLHPSHIGYINANWRHRFPKSERYLRVFHEHNGGLGLYEKKTNRLVAWSLMYHFAIGPVQVAEEERRKGYGSLITKAISKMYAERGFTPAGLVVQGNESSQLMFKKLGFKTSRFTIIQEMEAQYPLYPQ